MDPFSRGSLSLAVGKDSDGSVVIDPSIVRMNSIRQRVIGVLGSGTFNVDALCMITPTAQSSSLPDDLYN